MKRRRKRKGRIRWNRVFAVLFIIVFIVTAIKVTNYIVYNNKIYNNVVESSAKDAVVYKKYKTLKIYKKTMELIKSDNVSIVINDKKTQAYVSSKNVERNMPLQMKVYSKRLKYDNFDNSKALFIESTPLVKKSDKIVITLPGYLTKNKIVDIYGVKEDDTINQIYLGDKIKDTVTIRPNEHYVRYFVTYVKLRDIKVSNSTINKGSVANLNIKYIPETATVKDYEYTKIGDIFMINENNKIVGKKAGKDKVTIKHTISKIEATATITVKEEENKVETKNGITYVNGILIANKTYALPKDYDPGKVLDEAMNAFNEMKEAAAKDNIKLWIQSGYRSYKTQESLYNDYVKQDGKDKADTYSARPGHSEHQSGLAMDLNIIGSAFEGTKEAIWIEKNCYKYGFIVRYPKGKEHITGYKYEPWHIRYLGKENAMKVYNSGKTLEEYLGIDSKYKN